MKPILTKKQFVHYIEFIRERSEAQSNITYTFSKEFGCSDFWPYIRYESELISLLEEIFQDTQTKWISHYIYELEFGRYSKQLPITVDGKKIQLNTPEDLYDFLINNLEEVAE